MMSDSFLYSGDDAAMMSDLQPCHVAMRQPSGISSEREVVSWDITGTCS